MIALSRYKADHGEYPESLAELAPLYIAELPPDPYGAPSFGYRREAPDRYLLYSLGIDGKDDGGEPGVDYNGKPRQYADAGDDIYTWPRGPAADEPVLVPAQSAPAPGATPPSGAEGSGGAGEGADHE
jgi:hypothetical protein